MVTYTIPLRKGFSSKPRWRRTNAAVRTLRSYLEKHTKTERIVLGKHLNEEIWKHGGKNPPSKIQVDVLKKENVAYVELPGKPFPTPKEAEKEKAKGLLGKLGGKKAEEKKEEAKKEEKAEVKEAPRVEKKAPEKREVKAEKKEAPKAAAKAEKKTDSKK